MRQTKYSIKRASKLIGVQVDTLRNWERRYQFLSPSRGSRGERLYSEADIELLRAVDAHIRKGERISDVAERLRRGEKLAKFEQLAQTLSPETQHLIDELYKSLLKFDVAKTEFFHSNLKVSLNFIQRLEFVYGPLLEQLKGDRVAGTIGIAEAHFASSWMVHIIAGSLVTSSGGWNENNRKAVCAIYPREFREWGALVVAAHLKFQGWNVFYLGSQTPISEMIRAAQISGASLIYISVRDPHSIQQELSIIKDLKTRIPICLGGPGARPYIEEIHKPEFLHIIGSSGAKAVEEILKIVDSH